MNYPATVDRANPMNLSNSEYNFSPNTARLYLFSPRKLPTQVLRPHRYNFTPDFVDSISSGSNEYYNNVSNFISPSGGPVIQPDTIGMVMNTSMLDQMWSFVLIIDKAATAGYNNLQGVGGTRQIMIGYVSSYDEPYNRMTGTVNPNAILNFTNNTTVRMVNRYGAPGKGEGMYLSNHVDYMNETTAQQYSVPTYLMTPQELLNPYPGQGVDMIDCSNMVIDNVRAKTTRDGKQIISGSMSVDADLKSPVNHMSRLTGELENAVSMAVSNEEMMNNMSLTGKNTSLENRGMRAKMYLKNNVPGMRNLVTMGEIEPSIPITIGELDQRFEHALVVQPFELPPTSQWDVNPQENTTTKNIMSSFATMALSSITVNCGIAHIAFRYASWVKGGMDINSGWEILGCSMLMQVNDPNAQLRRLNEFKNLCEAHIFTILKQFSGDFDIMAYVNVGGEILVDLNFLDYHPATNGVGFYETNTRLGGMMNPMIADINVMTHNAASLNQLADTYIAKELGLSAIAL